MSPIKAHCPICGDSYPQPNRCHITFVRGEPLRLDFHCPTCLDHVGDVPITFPQMLALASVGVPVTVAASQLQPAEPLTVAEVDATCEALAWMSDDEILAEAAR